jgi:hypothetical protein
LQKEEIERKCMRSYGEKEGENWEEVYETKVGD